MKVKRYLLLVLFDLLTFFVFFPLFLMSFLSLVMSSTCIFFEKIFLFVFKESTLKYLKKIYIQIIVFKKKAFVNIFRISNSKSSP